MKNDNTNTLVLVLGLIALHAPIAGWSATERNPREQRFHDRYLDSDSSEYILSKPHVGAIAGVSDVPGDRTGGLMGVDVGFQQMSPLSFGVNFEVAGATQDYTRTSLLGKAAYNIGGQIPVIRYSYVGINAGWIHDSIDLTDSITFTDNYLGLGPVLGFDQPIDRDWTIGAEGKLISNFEEFTPNTLLVVGAVKYWL